MGTHYDRDALIAGTDLPALADELLGTRSGSARTPTWPCPNPNHAQTGRTPPVNVFVSHRGEQRWRCHGCGTGGTAIDLVLATKGTDIHQALEYLAGRTHQQPATPASPRPRPAAPTAHPDPEGLVQYVEDCARRLWRPEGRPTLQWLRDARGLDPDTLRTNAIGADPGPHRQPRPDGMPRARGAVLPVIVNGQPVYAQLRLTHPRDGQPRYLNPSGLLAPNPRLSHLRPATVERPHILVTEGAIDALTAAGAGYRSVAILGAGYPDEAIAAHLARLPGPLILAFDPDPAGQHGTSRLTALLTDRHRPAGQLRLTDGDLNDQRRISADWPNEFHHQVAAAAPCQPACRSLGAA
jgi:DNA primase